MKKLNQFFSTHMLLVSALGVVVLLPGCSLKEWFGSTDSVASSREQSGERSSQAPLAGDVIVSLDGKPLITTESLKKDKADLMASNPQLKMMLPHMDEKQFDKTLIDALTSQAVVERYIRDNKLDQKQEYKDELALTIKSITHMFNNKIFSSQLKSNVSDAEINAFYEQNKDKIPTLVVSQGGVKATGVEFDSESAAKEFLAKVQAAAHNLAKAAQGSKLAEKVRDFKSVHDQSVGLDSDLRSKIVATSKFPSSAIHKIGDKYWVVSTTSKEATTYQPLEKIKNELRDYLEKGKLTELVDKELAELRKKYNVVTNEKFFASEKPADQNVEEFDATEERE